MRFAVIFDMDGVLVNSLEYIPYSFRRVLNDYGIVMTDEELKAFNGYSMRDIVDRWNAQFGTDIQYVEFGKRAWEIERTMLEKEPRNEQLFAFLDDLKAHHIPLAVGTGSQRHRAELILDMLACTHYFDVVVTATEAKKHKPDPEIFVTAAEKLGVEPRYCVVFEDALTGITAAKTAGMKAVGVRTSLKTPEQLAQADLVINSFSNVSYQKILKLF